MKTIEEETVLLPVVVADSIIGELARHLDARGIRLPDDDGLSDRLADRADHLYQVNPDFRKKMRSNADQGRAGLNWLRCFMRHWLSAEYPMGSEVRRNLPEGFCIGQKP
jgi:hypothetical protein